MVLQDIDNFGVEHAIIDAIRIDPLALALIDEVCQPSGKTLVFTLHLTGNPLQALAYVYKVW
jgi:hypothetical protein